MKQVVAFALTLGLCLAASGPSFAAEAYTTSQPNQDQVQQNHSSIAPNFRLVKTFKGEDNYTIFHPTFSHDGKYLAANLHEANLIRVWDTQTGEPLADISTDKLFASYQSTDGFEFTPDNQHLAVIRAGYPLKEIDWHTQAVTKTIDLGDTGNKIEAYAFTPDYHWLAITTPSGVDLWDYTNGVKEAHYLNGQHINSLAVSPDGQWLALGKKGPIQESVALVNLATKVIEKYPLASLTPDQLKMLPDYQVRHVSFEDNQHLLIGYMTVPPEGQIHPTAPASVFLVNLETGQFTGPKPLSRDMISFESVELGKPFNTTFINTYNLNNGGRAASAADFLSPNLKTVKTLTDADLNAPMLNFRISPDQKWMAGSFKESDGKVRMRLYEMSPNPMSDTDESTPRSMN